MNIKDDIRPISYVKSHAAEIINQVNDTHRPIYVTQNGEAKAVLLDTESYEQMQKALSILKLISMGEKDIRNNKVVRQKDLFKEIHGELNG